MTGTGGEPARRAYPKRRAAFAAAFCAAAALAVWQVGSILGLIPRANAVLAGIALVMTPITIFVALMSGLRLLRGGDYLVLDRAGFAIDGIFDGETCHWTAVTRIALSEQHGHGQIEIDAAGSEGDPERTYLVNAHWMRLKPDAARELLTRYWRHARFGERFEGVA